ncbi:hypothetical protein [Streptomyces sp. NPDC048269]|uniref:hypothetical protein n=1 Tax=Streptomyces sp. NPDC048269 TaxID=3155753 RepID=UPI0034403FBF
MTTRSLLLRSHRESSLVRTEVSEILRNKKQEWEEYRSEVTAFELRKNLPVL